MHAPFEEYRDALKERIDRYGFEVVEREEGTILSVADGVMRISGLADARLHELVRVGDRADALILDLAVEHVGAVMLDDLRSVGAGDPVRATGRVAAVPVGEAMLGRIVDPLGRPLDGQGAVRADHLWPVERPAPPISDREEVTEPLLTGLTMVDALFPIGRGQRQLILGDRGTGKSTIAMDTVLNQGRTGVKCVYVSVGQMATDVLALRDALERSGALAHTTLVVASAEAPPGLRFVAPYAGCTMAEYFRDRGEDALVVFDDLDAHARAYRELSLLMRRPPGREAYPGDIFYIHARLLERATHLSKERGGGSLTALPIAETQASRISNFIPTNLISITDGQLFLDPQLFDRGYKPAVHVGTSVSRVGGKTQRASMKQVAGKLRLDIARFGELEVFTRFGARVEEETRKLLVRGARARELLRQAPASPIPLGEQVALLVALEEGLFDALDVRAVGSAAERLREGLRRHHPEVIEGFELGSPPSDRDRRGVEEAFP